jgi:mannose-1-phosphate guanylyltransferase
MTSQNFPFSIVLAGGDGQRLRPFTESWLGRHVPKQYCAFGGGQTMLEDALDRAANISGVERSITVVARHHTDLARPIFESGRRGRLVVQPENRDTAAGIFLALAYVRKHDPNAIGVILPSDHFVDPEPRFVESVGHAVRAVRCLWNQVVLLGASPTSAEPDYGWIVPGVPVSEVSGRAVHAVAEFVEKPHEAKAAELMANGALWNTFVMAARVETLWGLGWKYVPDLMPRFEALEETIGTPNEQVILDAIYRTMPERNFSSHLLQNARGSVSVIELDGVAWSDWGRPERIASALARAGITPAFPMTTIAR